MLLGRFGSGGGDVAQQRVANACGFLYRRIDGRRDFRSEALPRSRFDLATEADQQFRAEMSGASLQSMSRLRDLFPLLFGAIFVNVVAPAGGASGAALFVDHAARSGQSTARTAAGILLQLITSLGALVGVPVAGLSYICLFFTSSPAAQATSGTIV